MDHKLPKKILSDSEKNNEFVTKNFGAARTDYLVNHWLPYPEMPRGALRWGRVEQLRLGVQILADHKLAMRPSSGGTSSSSNVGWLGSDILVDGDLVAIMPLNQLILLAPNLTARPVRDEKWVHIKTWFEFMVGVRSFFQQKRFQEVKTPTLVECPGTEPSLEVFETYLEIGQSRQKYFLPTSPELNLKKLLAEGAERVFEIAPVFRNGEKGPKHSPEFLMLEWYRAFSAASAIKMDMIELIEQMADQLKVPRPVEVLHLTIPDLFKQHCDFTLLPNTGIEELRALANRLGVDVKSANSIDDFFYLIYLDRIECQWPDDRLVFVEKYPPYQAALARIGPDGWAERFEVYWKGLELGNAFHELNDPAQQRMRSEEDLQQKSESGRRPIGLDEKFFQALEYGMPPSAGIAVGLERLFMALKDLKDIEELKKVF